jgi:hypothetical protein
MVWRAMTAEELVSRPEARLEGSLLLIVVCAAALAVACVISLLLALVAIPTMLSGGSTGGFLALGGPARLGVLYAVPTLYLMAWALAFSILTLMRSPLAPSFAAGGLAGWLGVRLLIGVAGQFF